MLKQLLETIYLYPWKLVHDLASIICYGRFWINFPKPDITKRYGEVKMIYPLSVSPHVALMYLGIYEYPLRCRLEAILKPGDTFLDIGANIGHFSALALNRVGRKGHVIAFEPDHRYFKPLATIGRLNQYHNFIASRLAVGKRRSTKKLALTNSLGTSTLVDKLRSNEEVTKLVNVRIIRLDQYLKQKRISLVKLIKIDVEGFELDVLWGMSGFLNGAKQKPVILVEVYPFAWKIQGHGVSEFNKWLRKFGYQTESSINLMKLCHDKSDMYNFTLYPAQGIES